MSRIRASDADSRAFVSPQELLVKARPFYGTKIAYIHWVMRPIRPNRCWRRSFHRVCCRYSGSLIMPFQGRLGDVAHCPSCSHGNICCSHGVTGPAVLGSFNVHVNGRPALRMADPGVHSSCCGSNTWIAVGCSFSVIINGRGAHRFGDLTKHCGGVGALVLGSTNVIVGG